MNINTVARPVKRADLDAVIDNLIYKYTSGNLIPILGCELFKIDFGFNKHLNIHEYIIKENFYPNEDWPDAPATLSELSLSNPVFDYSSFLGCYNVLLERQKKLRLYTELASLKYFRSFLVATTFKEFENEFRRLNPQENIEVFKNDTISMHGLPSINFNNGIRKIIYLFDNIDSSLCALNDEQLLESMFSLANSPKNSSEHSLLSYLGDKTLLFIGCDFTDWFMRYCIRVLSNNPFSTKPIYIVNDHPPKLKYQESFFHKHNIQLVQTSPVDDFVDKFYAKALRKEKFKNRFQNAQVFISYSKEFDLETAKELYFYLLERGVETYFDEETKAIGGHEKAIKDYIMNPKTKILLSVVSKNLVDNLTLHGSNYIRDVEWYAANARNEVAAHSTVHEPIAFLPYFVDNEREYLQVLPAYLNSEFRFGINHGGLNSLFEKIQEFLS